MRKCAISAKSSLFCHHGDIFHMLLSTFLNYHKQFLSFTTTFLKRSVEICVLPVHVCMPVQGIWHACKRHLAFMHKTFGMPAQGIWHACARHLACLRKAFGSLEKAFPTIRSILGQQSFVLCIDCLHDVFFRSWLEADRTSRARQDHPS